MHKGEDMALPKKCAFCGGEILKYSVRKLEKLHGYPYKVRVRYTRYKCKQCGRELTSEGEDYEGKTKSWY